MANLLPSRLVPGKSEHSGFSLIELLCVMVIIAILASLLLSAVGRAYQRAKWFAGEMDGPAHVDEIRTKLIRYVQAQPSFSALSLDSLIKRCGLSSRCAAFLRSSEITYIPFSSADPETKIVFIQTVGKSRDARSIAYEKGWLTQPDPP